MWIITREQAVKAVRIGKIKGTHEWRAPAEMGDWILIRLDKHIAEPDFSGNEVRSPRVVAQLVSQAGHVYP